MKFRTWCETRLDKIAKLREVFHLIPQDARITLLNQPPRARPIIPTIDRKPDRGLWYAKGREWIEYLIYELKRPPENYVWELTVDPNRVRVIQNKEDALGFTKEFGKSNPYYAGYGDPLLDSRPRPQQIDWGAVSEQYAGIDFCDWYERILYGPLLYLASWDVASGCLWDQSGLRNVKLLLQWDGTQYTPPSPQSGEGGVVGYSSSLPHPPSSASSISSNPSRNL